MKKLTLILTIPACMAIACKKKKQVTQCTNQPITQAQLQGKWKEYPYPVSALKHFVYSTYAYEFYGDSVKIEEVHVSDVAESCRGTAYVLHAKGVYTIKPYLALNFKATYTDAAYTPLTPAVGCDYAPPLNEDFYAYTCNDTMVIEPPSKSSHLYAHRYYRVE